MHDREHETPIGFEQLGDGAEQRFDGGHIHQGIDANGGIEARLIRSGKRQQLILVGGVSDVMGDPIRVIAGARAAPIRSAWD
ncbi:MAG: hypothetical protein U0528_18395 [Anaerolineae bacterium]